MHRGARGGLGSYGDWSAGRGAEAGRAGAATIGAVDEAAALAPMWPGGAFGQRAVGVAIAPRGQCDPASTVAGQRRWADA